MKIQHGKQLKDGASKTITFPEPFHATPHVTVTPHWQNQHAEVGHRETIDTITKTNFTVVSGNAAPNYYIQWIAVASS